MINSEIKICQNCRASFTIDASDFEFYEKIKVPAPTFCPECRFIRRLMLRNERNLSKRKCDLCGQDKILSYSPDSKYKVYCYSCWWSDQWDGIDFAQDYDFSRSFFEQWKELMEKVPRMGVIKQGTNVNSEYINRASDNKDCYLIFAANNNENCHYGTSYWSCKDSMDGYSIHNSEKLYECIDCSNCYNLKYSQECNSCIDSFFLINCKNCSSCFGCVNLRNKNYCIFNKQYTKEEYQKKVEDFKLDSFSIKGFEAHLNDLKNKNIVPALVSHHSVDVSGNWIENCKSVRHSFDCNNVEVGKYLMGVGTAKDSMDYTYWGMGSELMYESISVGRQCSSSAFVTECWDQLIRAQYCMNCHSSSYFFGCVGLKKKQYCILNKQYTKEEYEQLVPKIIEHMNNMPYIDKKGRVYKYGEFFPPELSPFSYNETIAQEYFPLTKEQAIEQGYSWKDPEERNITITIKSEELPDHIKDVKDDILTQVIECQHNNQNCNEQCTTAFKIIPQELEFYKKMNLPLPRLCPNCRHYQRIKQRNPLKLWHRQCMCNGKESVISKQELGYKYQNTITHTHGTEPCLNEFETTYAPERKEIVYCEQCYQQEVV